MKPPLPPRERRDRVLRIALPIILLALGLATWEFVVRIENVPSYVLPAPGLIAKTLIADRTLLFRSLLATFATTVEGFLLAAIGGVCTISPSPQGGAAVEMRVPLSAPPSRLPTPCPT